MDVDIENKNILLFIPKYFGYEERIKSAMERCGANVCCYDERIGNDFLSKAFTRKLKSVIYRKIDKYYNTILREVEDMKFDYILFVTPETVTSKILAKMKKKYYDSQFILYLWDSINNKKDVLSIVHYFDDIFTFDKNDANKYDFKYRPLFYSKEHIERKKEYDLCFIGTVHSDRYKIFKKMEKIYYDENKKVYSYLFIQHRLIYFIQKIFNKNFNGAKYNDFHTTPLAYDDYINIVASSETILDVEHPLQTGLTMRCIEMIGSKKKIITTNKSVEESDFYNSKNINIIDRNEISITKEFIMAPYTELDDKIYNKYSIDGWLCEIFNSTKLLEKDK